MRKKVDPINPPHYKGDTVMVFIETFNLGFCLGNVVKYVARSPEKGATLDDLKKAQWYLTRQITNLEKSDGPSSRRKNPVQKHNRRVSRPTRRRRRNGGGSGEGFG